MQLITVLPSALNEFVKLTAAKPTEANRLKRLARYMLGKYRSEEIPLDQDIEISAEHFRQQLDTQYLGDLKKFKAAGVIVSNEQYTPGMRSESGERLTLGQCKKYRFAPQYVFTDPDLVTITEKRKARFNTADPLIQATVPLLARLTLTLSAAGLRAYVRELVTDQFIRERCKVGEEIGQGFHYLAGDPIPKDLKLLLHIARRSGLELIQYREKCYLAPLDQFIARRVAETRTNYLDTLIRLKEIRKRPNIFCARNATNRRLDTNLTNIASVLLPLIRLDGERLVSIDLATSQFTILAHVIEQSFEAINNLGNENKLEKTLMCRTAKSPSKGLGSEIDLSTRTSPSFIDKEIISTINVTKFIEKSDEKCGVTCSIPSDLREFIDLTKSGIFYDRFADLLSADSGRTYTRYEAKKMMFITLFSAHRYNPSEKQLLAHYYPSLVTWTNEFKKLSIKYRLADGLPPAEARDKGNAALAVLLQNIESGIFIDQILARLLREGFRLFTKHDSILCKESDLDRVRAIVTQELDGAFGVGGYQLKIETV